LTVEKHLNLQFIKDGKGLYYKKAEMIEGVE
jgi:hypothetical protein